MIQSMTAFARQEAKSLSGSMVWEIRSVNHRYLELQFKLPETLRQIEPSLRDIIRKNLARGKVECTLRLQTDSNSDHTLSINENLAKEVINAGMALQYQIDNVAPINVLDILRWPGVLKEPDPNKGLLIQESLALFGQALKDLNESRAREGDELQVFIQQRLSNIEDITDAVRTSMPEILAPQRHKLQDKLADLVSDLDSDRIEQELVLLANKIDVDEELDRLVTHIGEVKRVLKAGGTCGRRLDFLMQELNREANTLSSKSIVSDSTQAAVELKVLIEQMREQIQNIE